MSKYHTQSQSHPHCLHGLCRVKITSPENMMQEKNKQNATTEANREKKNMEKIRQVELTFLVSRYGETPWNAIRAAFCVVDQAEISSVWRARWHWAAIIDSIEMQCVETWKKKKTNSRHSSIAQQHRGGLSLRKDYFHIFPPDSFRTADFLRRMCCHCRLLIVKCTDGTIPFWRSVDEPGFTCRSAHASTHTHNQIYSLYEPSQSRYIFGK